MLQSKKCSVASHFIGRLLTLQYHDEYQQAFARFKHKKVSEEEYRSAPDRYELRTCPKHEEEELKKVCKHCYKTFCYGCDTDLKCSVLKGRN